MAQRILTGGRIRRRRLDLGLKQSVLARQVGISAAYLNLIEHNKRRIGGKLLVDLARALKVGATVLSEGAEASLLAELQEAAQSHDDTLPPLESAQDFAAAAPGWAALMAAQQHRLAAIGRTVEVLTDRLAHDPFLSASVHAMLSSVTAIRSAASILVESGDIDPRWQARFQRNLNEDARRLADEVQRLVAYLDGAGDAQASLSSPQEELEAFLAAQNWHLAALDEEIAALDAGAQRQARVGEISAALIARAPELSGQASRDLAARWLARLAEDARLLPRAPFEAAVEAEAGAGTGAGAGGRLADPLALARHFGTDPGRVLRRLACLPVPEGGPALGLVLCDGSGAIGFRKPIEGFAPPQFGAACPLWPLYQALGRISQPLRSHVETAAPNPVRFIAYAVAQPVWQAGFDAPPVIESTMLIRPPGRDEPPAHPARPIGISCRICPRARCAARHEPSILTADV